ncbi:hypothetical protein XCR_2909 [Xanthomonas campestris pv. raphani 756C]|nr:hypothetical protein XCR_2909 [Xanthomonas campestris pv. raphani 756C]
MMESGFQRIYASVIFGLGGVGWCFMSFRASAVQPKLNGWESHQPLP